MKRKVRQECRESKATSKGSRKTHAATQSRGHASNEDAGGGIDADADTDWQYGYRRSNRMSLSYSRGQRRGSGTHSSTHTKESGAGKERG